MTILKATNLCLAAALVFETTNAFTVAPPTKIDVPVVSGNQVLIDSASASSLASRVQTSPSNLPSQSQLLERVGSLSVAAASTETKAAPTKAAPAKAVQKPASISIAEINFDGKVKKTESDEYVVIQNSSKDTIDVSGYIVYPATTGNQGSTFSFPKGSSIKPNSSVRIYTNEIHKETGGYSWGSGKALWSNSGGLAVLKDDKGTKLGEFKYTPTPPAAKKS